jgi:putative endonuclease
MPAQKAKNRLIGNLGERYACKLLRENGYKIIDRNFQTSFGEIDIISKDGNTLVFVEVKTRKGDNFGFPEEAVTKQKLKHIVKSAYQYIKQKKPKYHKLRIDVVALTVTNNVIVKSKLINVDEI